MLLFASIANGFPHTRSIFFLCILLLRGNFDFGNSNNLLSSSLAIKMKKTISYHTVIIRKIVLLDLRQQFDHNCEIHRIQLSYSIQKSPLNLLYPNLKNLYHLQFPLDPFSELIILHTLFHPTIRVC